jgi:hypothetical protein
MKKMFLAVLGIALISSFSVAEAALNYNGKFALYLNGTDCGVQMADCTGGITHTATDGSARFDLYLMAIDVNGIAGARYGLHCNETTPPPNFFFYGWTSCSSFEISSSGWPGCGEDNAQTWTSEQAGPHVTVGILDVYTYPGAIARLCVGPDSRVGFAEFCDGSEPSPLCNTVAPGGFGCFGVNRLGYNPCSEVPVEQKSWGAVKSLYR